MIYAPTDVQSITVPGGCGNPHAKIDQDGVFTIECPTCEPLIIGLRLGWGYELHQVAPTCDEIAIAESQEKQAKRAQNQTWGNPNAIAESLVAALGGPKPSGETLTLLQQLALMSDEERAAIRAMLGDTPAAPAVPATEAEVPPPPAAPDAKPPVAKKAAAKKAATAAVPAPAE